MNIRAVFFRYLIGLLLVTISFSAQAKSLDEIKKSGKIYVAFQESALQSVNYEIALEFAKFLNVELVVVKTTWDENFSQDGKLPANYKTDPEISYTPDALRKADLICGTIYLREWRKKFFDYAGSADISDLLIISKSHKNIKTHDDLKGLRIAFLENSSYESNMLNINEKIGGGIEFIKTSSEIEAQNLLLTKQVDALISVSYLALGFVKNNPEYKIAFPVAHTQKTAWAVAKNNDALRLEVQNFFETISGNGTLDKLFTKQYGISYSTYLEIINSYSVLGKATRDLDEIIESGKIVIALRECDMVYRTKGKKQFNQILAEKFADFLGVKIKYVIAPNFAAYFKNKQGKLIKDSAYLPPFFNKFDLACDLIPSVEWMNNKVDIIPFIPNTQVVIGKVNQKINSIKDLKRLRGITTAGSVYEETLLKNGITNIVYGKPDEFFAALRSGKADYIMAGDAVFSLWQYPDFEAKMTIGDLRKDGWAIKKNQAKLRQKILEFLAKTKNDGSLDGLFNQQTGLTLKTAKKYLTVLHETYQQGKFPFVFYGANQGLPQEDVLSIFQDQEGYIWFGTYSGAVRYNGRVMQLLELNETGKSNSVFDMAQDANQSIFFAGLHGISVLNSGKVETIFPEISFKHIFIDSKNNKWFFGNSGIYRLDSKNQQESFSKNVPSLPRNIYSIVEDTENNCYYLTSSQGLYKLTGEYKVEQLNREYCHSAYIDKQKQLWLSTQSGLYVCPLKELSISNLGKNFDKTWAIENKEIKEIVETSDGSIWLVSDYTIYQVLSLNQPPVVYNQKIGLLNQRILSFCEDHENNLWFGYSGGVQKLTNTSLRLIAPNRLNSYVNSMVEDSKGRMWASSANEVFYIHEGVFNFSSQISSSKKSYVVKILPNQNILIASVEGFYEIDVNSLKVIKERKFSQNISHLEGIFISSKEEIFLLTGLDGIIYYFKSIDSEPIAIENGATSLVYQLVEFNSEIIGTNNTGLVIFNRNTFDRLEDLNFFVWTLYAVGDRLWVGSDIGLGYYKNYKYFSDMEIAGGVNAIVPAYDKNKIWVGTNQGFSYIDKKRKRVEFTVDSRDGLQGNEIAINGLHLDNKGLLWVATFHGIATFDFRKKRTEKFTPECFFEKTFLNGKAISQLPSELNSNQNNLTIELCGLSFKDEKSIQYDFFLKGSDEIFVSSNGREFKASYTNLPSGNYSLVYRTKGKDGIWSYYQSRDFKIIKPIWERWWFFLLLLAAAVTIVYFVVKIRERRLKRQNEQLERIIEQRTKEVVKQKEDIEKQNRVLEQQKEEIIAQRDEIEEQRDLATRQKKDIMDSIIYARRIQQAILPPESLIEKSFSDHFILYKPRDIVSGDYYWMSQIDNKTILVAADCTGHGVPGAFMSLLGNSFLNEIVNKDFEKNHALTLHANEILNQLREQIIAALHQKTGANDTKDGMDMSLCVFNSRTNILEFSGAFNPLYLIRSSKSDFYPSEEKIEELKSKRSFFQIDENYGLIEYKADRMPVGVSDLVDSFTNHELQVYPNDALYIFSDGFVDQFGGARGKKFKPRAFKTALLNMQHQNMSTQKEILDNILENWKGDEEQVDDILVMGIKI